jgi:NTP pyrophosphatase (non-canonical NTP hydrolase)
MKNISIEQAQKIVDEWIQSTNKKYFSELGNLGQLTEEVGEVARIITRTYGDQNYKPQDTPKELSEELSDVLFVLICLANQTGIDLTKAFNDNLQKKINRDKNRH